MANKFNVGDPVAYWGPYNTSNAPSAKMFVRNIHKNGNVTLRSATGKDLDEQFRQSGIRAGSHIGATARIAPWTDELAARFDDRVRRLGVLEKLDKVVKHLRDNKPKVSDKTITLVDVLYREVIGEARQ